MNKKIARLKRSFRARRKIKTSFEYENIVRICAHRTIKNIYVQAIDSQGKVLFSSSSLDKNIKNSLKNGGNVEASKAVGKDFGDKFNKFSFPEGTVIVFDRSGFKYHGRIKALADAIRECNINF